MSGSTAVLTRVPTGTWEVDPAHSRVEFQVKHLGIATVRGHFAKFGGTLELDEDLASSRAYGSVEAASVNTNDDGRDAHLRSADFFDVAQYPQISFASKAIVPTGDDTFQVTGDLSLHGVTHEVTLDAKITGTEEDPWGNERVGLEVSGELVRGDYGITFNQALGSGNVMVSDKVKLPLGIPAVKKA